MPILASAATAAAKSGATKVAAKAAAKKAATSAMRNGATRAAAKRAGTKAAAGSVAKTVARNASQEATREVIREVSKPADNALNESLNILLDTALKSVAAIGLVGLTLVASGAALYDRAADKVGFNPFWILSMAGVNIPGMPSMPDIQWPFGDRADSQYSFEPLDIATPYLIDNSPVGSYDFTLIDPATDSDRVAVPSPCQGTIKDAGYWGGYGNALELACSDGKKMLFAHFASLDVKGGDAVAIGQPLGIQGSTGNSTGPHIHLEVTLPGKALSDRAATLPYIQNELFPFWKSGMSRVASAAGKTLNDETLKCAIGNAEGTMHDDCSKNPAYFGHTDPGNGAANLGAFSYQHEASSPDEADAKQIERLRNAEKDIQQKAIDKFGVPLSKAALASALDLWNQAPLAGNDFVDHLTAADPTPQQIIDARSRSFIDPASGALDAPGLGNNMNRVKADQQRRVTEVMEQLNK